MNPIQAVFEVVYARLVGANPLWGQNVRPVETVDDKTERPYVAFFLVDEFPEGSHPSKDIHRVIVTIKGVAGDESEQDALGTALAIQEAISELFADTGETDAYPSLAIHANWYIQTVTEGRVVYIPEMLADSIPSYHAGHQYEFLLERK